MVNETRNELLEILTLTKELEKGENVKTRIEWLLERFEYQIKEEKEDAERKLQQANNNLDMLEYVRKEIGVE